MSTENKMEFCRIHRSGKLAAQMRHALTIPTPSLAKEGESHNTSHDDTVMRIWHPCCSWWSGVQLSLMLTLTHFINLYQAMVEGIKKNIEINILPATFSMDTIYHRDNATLIPKLGLKTNSNAPSNLYHLKMTYIKLQAPSVRICLTG